MGFYSASTKTIINSSAVVADENSDSIEMGRYTAWSCQLDWTSTTAAGTVKMQESNDGTTWTDISGASQAISNDSGNAMFKSTNSFQCRYIRALVDYTSGSITTVTCVFTKR